MVQFKNFFGVSYVSGRMEIGFHEMDAMTESSACT